MQNLPRGVTVRKFVDDPITRKRSLLDDVAACDDYDTAKRTLATALGLDPDSNLARLNADGSADTSFTAAAGSALFGQHCTICHGIDGKGGKGPRLNRAVLNRAPDDAALRSVIASGLEPAMPGAWFFTDDEVAIDKIEIVVTGNE